MNEVRWKFQNGVLEERDRTITSGVSNQISLHRFNWHCDILRIKYMGGEVYVKGGGGISSHLFCAIAEEEDPRVLTSTPDCFHNLKKREPPPYPLIYLSSLSHTIDPPSDGLGNGPILNCPHGGAGEHGSEDEVIFGTGNKEPYLSNIIQLHQGVRYTFAPQYHHRLTPISIGGGVGLGGGGGRLSLSLSQSHLHRRSPPTLLKSPQSRRNIRRQRKRQRKR